MFTLNIGKSNCRGIIIYVKVSLIASELEVISTFSEYLFIQIKFACNSTLTIGAFYRSPFANTTNNNELIALLKKINTIISSKFILLGDFNLSNII